MRETWYHSEHNGEDMGKGPHCLLTGTQVISAEMYDSAETEYFDVVQDGYRIHESMCEVVGPLHGCGSTCFGVNESEKI